MPRLFQKNILINDSKGLTLVEILVTASLIVFVSAFALGRIKNQRSSLERVADTVASDIRTAQSLALFSRKFKGSEDQISKSRCGYGITQPNSDAMSYIIYAGPPATKDDGSINDCDSRNYKTTGAYPSYRRVSLPSNFDFITNPRFKDIFFQPPGPTTYINNSSTSPSVEKITVKKMGVTKNDCEAGSPDCIYICVYLSGRVEVTRNIFCP